MSLDSAQFAVFPAGHLLAAFRIPRSVMHKIFIMMIDRSIMLNYIIQTFVFDGVVFPLFGDGGMYAGGTLVKSGCYSPK